MTPREAYEQLWRDGVRVDEIFSRRKERSLRFRLELAAKRGIDVVCSSLLLAIAAPIVACGAIAIMMTSPGPPFFAAARCGTNDRLFKCLKLRTMHVDQEGILARHGLSDRGSDGRLLVYERDPRINVVGTFLRRASIDELPQLWNVLRGDMSLVGPRPLARYMLEEFVDIRETRGAVRPGITGLWQVRNRMKNASVIDMVRDDGEYIATFDLMMDLRILLATIPRLIEPAIAPSESR